MFIHSRKVRARVVFTLLSLVSLFFAYLFYPRSGSSGSNALLWAVFLTFVGLFAVFVYLWIDARKLQQDPLPDPAKWSGPNQISRKVRIANVMLSLLLISYGTLGVWIDDIYIPGKRTSGLHLHGTAAWLMYLAIMCAVASLLTTVLDHYDRRNNELIYRHAGMLFQWFAWTLVLASLIEDFFSGIAVR